MLRRGEKEQFMKSFAAALLVLSVTTSGMSEGLTTYSCRCFADYGLSFEDFGFVTVTVRNGLSRDEVWEFQTQACQTKFNSKAPRAIQCVKL